MADEVEQQDAQEPEAPQREQHEDAPTPVSRTVPYERFAEVNRQAKARQRELEQLTSRLEELESKDQSELEKERGKRQRFEREAAELTDRVTRIERQSWVREAARDARFDDPDDAIAFIDVKDIDDMDDAVQAVKDLAKKKKKLLRSDPPPAEIGQVVKDGRAVQRGDGEQRRQPDQQGADLLAQLQTASEAQGWQAIPLEDR